MPNKGLLFLSACSLVLGVLFILFPQALLKLSRTLDRTLAVLDERLMRYRYLWGLLAFVLGFALFRLALIVW